MPVPALLQNLSLTDDCSVAVAYPFRKNWPSAESHCVAKGGHLASIEGPEEERMVLATIKRQCPGATSAFIGYTDATAEGQFKWQGRPAAAQQRPYTRWSPGEPNNGNARGGGAGEDHTEIVADTGLWNDIAGVTMGHCLVCSFDIDRDAMKHQACVNDCTGHGDCHVLAATCSCDKGWEGLDCSVQTTQILKAGTRSRTYSVLDLLQSPYGKEKKRKLTISEAGAHCTSAGGILPTLANKGEEDHLAAVMKTECSLQGGAATVPLGLMDFAQSTVTRCDFRLMF